MEDTSGLAKAELLSGAAERTDCLFYTKRAARFVPSVRSNATVAQYRARTCRERREWGIGVTAVVYFAGRSPTVRRCHRNQLARPITITRHVFTRPKRANSRLEPNHTQCRPACSILCSTHEQAHHKNKVVQ